ncbi:choice-of-anchor Q domain-containing protein [Tahibacter sp. UC22_41]|uniref:choice-of-anchor Q domain-containing protein n=1 Tax=Tahibacter sp. UC22_41 TaxID=3350178 RepID=UPI0036DB1088
MPARAQRQLRTRLRRRHPGLERHTDRHHIQGQRLLHGRQQHRRPGGSHRPPVHLQNCRRQIGSGGDNIAGDASCFPASAELNDRVGLDPRLGELANNGGPTKTVALRAGSPAIDQVIVNAASCAGADQRGAARPSGPLCDIGAYERNGDLLFDNGFQ